MDPSSQTPPFYFLWPCTLRTVNTVPGQFKCQHCHAKSRKSDQSRACLRAHVLQFLSMKGTQGLDYMTACSWGIAEQKTRAAAVRNSVFCRKKGGSSRRVLSWTTATSCSRSDSSIHSVFPVLPASGREGWGILILEHIKAKQTSGWLLWWESDSLLQSPVDLQWKIRWGSLATLSLLTII